MASTELIVIGGFLGAGKTTSILSMAKLLLEKGKKIGIVTNDQGSDLVDTSFLKQSGMSVLEVTGGCFCCNFDQFTEKIQQLKDEEKPEIILAEPVGSCTDLIATIFKPIKQNYNETVTIRPLSIVADPKRVRSLMMEENSGFHSEVNYLFTKQLEEADVIVLNKSDKLSEIEIEGISGFLRNKFNGTEVISVSALMDINIELWSDLIAGDSLYSEKLLNIDYDIYAEAEARLGWLNLSGNIYGDKTIDINSFIEKFINGVRYVFKEKGYEIAHLKVYAINENDWAKASVTTVKEEANFNKRADLMEDTWNIIINARVDITPLELEKSIQEVLNKIIGVYSMKLRNLNIQCFKPGRPNPKYRYKD